MWPLVTQQWNQAKVFNVQRDSDSFTNLRYFYPTLQPKSIPGWLIDPKNKRLSFPSGLQSKSHDPKEVEKMRMEKNKQIQAPVLKSCAILIAASWSLHKIHVAPKSLSALMSQSFKYVLENGVERLL